MICLHVSDLKILSEFRYNFTNIVQRITMQTIRLEVEDSKLETVLNIIQNLKESLITKYEISNDGQEFSEDIVNNSEDGIYDKFLQISKNEAAARVTQAVEEVKSNKATLFNQEEYDNDMNKFMKSL